jgi:glycine C-acetyltransferase
MSTLNPAALSLADFYVTDTPGILDPPPDFLRWVREADWAFSQYEPVFASAPTPRALLRQGDEAHPVVNLGSYNYLGLGMHPAVLDAAAAALRQYGAGASGPPMLSGRTDLHAALEERLGRLLQRDAVALFTTGFAGALGAISGLARRGDVVVADQLAHMSLVDGAKLSGARLVHFAHNDPASLDEVLGRERTTRKLVVVEGIYSMDGDMARLPELLDVAEAHGAALFIDEAHSILACGPTGGGVVEHFDAQQRVGVHFATCSKALASLGAFAAGSEDTIRYMRYFAHSYTFSAGLPAVIVGAMLGALDVNERHPELRGRLWDNARYFRQELRAMGLDTGASDTYVVPIVVGPDRVLLYEACAQMRARGLFLPPVDYPTVPEEQTRYRASITAAHTRADMDEALDVIEETLVPALRVRGRLRGRQV